MRVRRSSETTDAQLELFANNTPSYAHPDSIRSDGRKTLAPVPAEDGSGTGSEGAPPGNAVRRPGEDQRRDARIADATDETRADTTTSARPGLGDSEGALHPSPAGIRRTIRVEPPRNQANYR